MTTLTYTSEGIWGCRCELETRINSYPREWCYLCSEV